MLVFNRGRKTGQPSQKPLEQRQEPTTNSMHMHIYGFPGHIGGRGMLSPLRHPSAPLQESVNDVMRTFMCGDV